MTLMSSMFVNTAASKGAGWMSAASRVNLEIAEQPRRIFFLQLKLPVPMDELLPPKFWQFCKDLKPHDRVEIVMPDPMGRQYSFTLEVARNVGAAGPQMAPYPYEPPGLRVPITAEARPQIAAPAA